MQNYEYVLMYDDRFVRSLEKERLTGLFIGILFVALLHIQ